MKRVLTLVAIGLVMQSCGGSQPRVGRPTPHTESAEKIYGLLIAWHDDWRGVGYQWGGLSKRGIDCSGFAHLAFREIFGIKVPRTTELLAKTGVKIKPSEIRIGDLVFYNTTEKDRHVGIYMGNGRFLHASTSRGVMISDMKLDYWASRYWKAMRVLPT